jgi:hypothetical protein
MFHFKSNAGSFQMNALSFAQQHLSGFQLDDSSVALIALLAGMMGGYRLSGWHDQIKAKRAKVPVRRSEKK